ncbi:class I SAM-dependent methyltransferase [Paenarthrobacter sp. Z7-10]|nr:class I SAM-dependent methyltransferase [Paenarthrobacter sp. Z7-10]
MANPWTEESYDERYRAHGSLWSGKPNPVLLSETADLAPGSVLDAGSGEGADAIWLASRGWQVTAVDFSSVALERAAVRARENAPTLGQRITRLHRDLTSWQPSKVDYDLVCAQFLQLAAAQRAVVFGSLAAAVAPGGMLLIVGHDASDRALGVHRPSRPEVYFTADAIAAQLLEPGAWEVSVSGPRERTVTSADGQTIVVHDEILRAHRRH